MTAQELIDELKEYPPDALVVQRNFSKGYNEFLGFILIDLRPCREDDNMGKFEGDYLQSFSSEPDSFEAILLGRA